MRVRVRVSGDASDFPATTAESSRLLQPRHDTMSRKPRADVSSILGQSPSHALPTPASSTTEGSPPSAKKQKTAHTPITRRRPPRQSQLNAFLSTPSTSSAAKKASPASSSARNKNAKNASILSFFKPVPGSSTKKGSQARNDELFISHGGYGLDVSDPEDGEDGEQWLAEMTPAPRRELLLERRTSGARDREEDVGTEAGSATESVDDESESGYTPPPEPAPPLAMHTPAQSPELKPKLENRRPSFDPKKLKLDLSRSMLFSKTASLSLEDTLKRPRTGSHSSDSMAEEEGFELDVEPRLAKNANHGGDIVKAMLKRPASELDEIEATPEESRSPNDEQTMGLGAEDDIEETQREGFEGGLGEEYEDIDDEDVPWEELQSRFSFDPTRHAIENGYSPIEDYQDLEIVMKPPDDALQCPLCQTSLADLTEQESNAHVNGCLDGNPPAPPPKQKAPIYPPKPSPSGPSAFTKLMSTNKEERRWSAAEKTENDTHGKRGVERTCPFYKILFNGPIVVDGFRYGAVPNCTAYFLSHFHSDHYVGLTSKWNHGPIYCSRVTANLVRTRLKVDPQYVRELPWEAEVEVPQTGGVRVRGLDANHCPGSMMFLFEKGVPGGKKTRILHCGDFRADPSHLNHPLLRPEKGKEKENRIDACYLDTTYLDPKFAFPTQKPVINACAEMCVSLNDGGSAPPPPPMKSFSTFLPQPAGKSADSKPKPKPKPKDKGRLLVVVGTYSIGKERICIGIARALSSKIYAAADKTRTVRQLEDPSLTSLLTSDPSGAQVHMASLMELSPNSLRDYLHTHRRAFSRIVGFRPSGWNYRPPAGRALVTATPRDVLYNPVWRSNYATKDMVQMRGSDQVVKCFPVPYSEHSSFRELTMFVCALDIVKVVPTVNVGKEKAREKMRGWIEKWEAERRRNGVFRLGEGEGEGRW